MANTMRWFYKTLEGMVTNLAVVSSDTPQTVRFADKEGFVFDRITFNQDVAVEDALIRNGVKEVLDNAPIVTSTR